MRLTLLRLRASAADPLDKRNIDKVALDNIVAPAYRQSDQSLDRPPPSFPKILTP